MSILNLSSLTLADVQGTIEAEIKSSKEWRYEDCWQYVETAYNQAKTKNLRINLKTWITRDNTGILCEPVNLSDWPECSLTDAISELTNSIWSDAVRIRNISN